MRFYEFADTDLLEDLEAALKAREKALTDQSKIIALRKKALSNRKARQANRDTVAQLASRNRESE